MMRFGNLIIGAAFVAGLFGTRDASVHAVKVLNAREAWAENLSNDEAGIFFSAAGPTSRGDNFSKRKTP